MKRALVVVGAGLLVLGGIAVAFVVESVEKKTVYESSAITVPPPAQYTDADETAYMEAVANHDPLPIGWVKTDDRGTVTAAQTGYVEPFTHEVQIVVTIRDDAADLTEANLFLDGNSVFRASVGTGSIIVRNGLALATMTTLVPASPPYTVAVKWVNASGVEQSHVLDQLP